MNEDIEYPIRINRYLFLKGYCSRRKADTLIEEGKVFINGTPAVLGQQVEESDRVELDPVVENLKKGYQYIAYNKPVGVVSHNPQKGERSVSDVTKLKKEIVPIGRLDKASRGLMLLSDDGRIVNALLHPDFAHEREYEVKVDKRITESALGRMRKGVRIEGYMTKPAEIKRTSEYSFRITLTEGKKHQIRRMCAALGYAVRDLKRVRMMHLILGSLKEGAHRPLSPKETKKLLQIADLV